MRGKCWICNYDSGELDIEALQVAINSTKRGKMVPLYDNDRNLTGWYTRCPTCATENSIGIDGEGDTV